MKIVICNVPLRPEKAKTIFPPLGALAVIQSLQLAGYQSDFYDINFFRPSEQELSDYFGKSKFDIVGISATVSTSYKFVKKIVAIIKSVSPETVIIVGGALTASSEIILKFNAVDFCVIGEGERAVANLVKYISAYGKEKLEDLLKEIKGLCFLNTKGNVVFTGSERQLSVDEIQDPDYSLIEKYSNITQYVTDPFFYEQFAYDPRSRQEKRSNKKLATVVSSRGCVNRCTFCYRWQRGIRIFPVDRIIKHIQNLIEKYNIGFISFGDEDFGANKKWSEEFAEKIKPLDILYRISGICCDNVDLPILKKLRDSGCVAVHYGFESGSDEMLKVMEKRTNVQLNSKIARATYEAGLQTVPALVIGMPGETYKTVGETTDFVKKITEFLPREPISSINALVVLPGTPVYEYARYKGLLGKTLEEEERYLLRISDQGGASMKQLNLTDYPYFIVQGWIRCICWAVRYHYYRVHNFSRQSTARLFYESLRLLFKRKKVDKAFRENLYRNPMFYRLRYIIAVFAVMYKNYKDDRRLFTKRCNELIVWPFKVFFGRNRFTRYVSLRELLKGNENFDFQSSMFTKGVF